jgi:uncharacterized protein (TIGR02145 family)
MIEFKTIRIINYLIIDNNFNLRKWCFIILLILLQIDSIETKAQQVKIGKQEWADKNLDVSTFRNGDLIPHAKTNEEWEKAGLNGDPAWCYYNNDSILGLKFGKLYNWYAVNDSRGLAPLGWHVASDTDWSTLKESFENEVIACIELKSTEHWLEPENGNNHSNFGGLPGGFRYLNGNFSSMGFFAYWWTSSRGEYPFNAWFRSLGNDFKFGRACYDKDYGFSVRCIKD